MAPRELLGCLAAGADATMKTVLASATRHPTALELHHYVVGSLLDLLGHGLTERPEVVVVHAALPMPIDVLVRPLIRLLDPDRPARVDSTSARANILK